MSPDRDTHSPMRTVVLAFCPMPQHSHHVIRRSTWVVLWFVLAATAIAAGAPAADSLPDRTARLVATARVWAHAKFFHPYLAYKDIDWDAALIAAMPKLDAATTVEQYRAAMQEMLGKLADPVTRVHGAQAAQPQFKAQAPRPIAEWLTTPAPGIVLVDLAGFAADGWNRSTFEARGKQVTAELEKAKVAIIDLRIPGASALAFTAVKEIENALPAIEEWPVQRMIEHHGYRTQDGQTNGDYFSTFITVGAEAPKPAARSGPAHVVFIADVHGGVPSAALALQAAGRARILVSGPLAEDAVVRTEYVSLGAGLMVQIRIGESLWPAPAGDVRAPEAELRARALALAKTLTNARATPRPRKLLALPPLRPRNDLDYADQAFPPRTLRVLAGIRAWAVLEYFNPYRYLAEDWNRVLGEMLPKLEAAANRDAYIEVLREMGARAGDGHIHVAAATPALPIGETAIDVRLVEGKLVITRLVDVAEAKQLGLAVGAVIETVDGKPSAAALAAARPSVSGSTAEGRDQRTAWWLFRGDDGTATKVGVRAPDGKLREVSLVRRAAHRAAREAPSTAPHWKQLPGNVGYVDMMQLTAAEVDAMFAALGATRAIVFDIRGYPNPTIRLIAPRVNTRKAIHVAQFLQPLVNGSRATDEATVSRRVFQRIPALQPSMSIYAGKVVVLIDDNAVSRAEHACLFLQETANATFIGSPTHGANGDVSYMRLPGGLRLRFTGQEVRHADGKQLQRVGIQPHITVRPTIAGLRAGKDEVLERALVFLEKGK